MAKRDRNLETLRRGKHNVSPRQLDTVLMDFGFIGEQDGTSHKRYRHPLLPNVMLVVVEKNPLNPYIIRDALKVIDSLEKEE